MDPASRELGQVGRGFVTILALAVVLLTGAAARPGTSEAFVGESLVINPVTKDLTGPAKTIITNPTFLPETVTSAGTAAGAGATEAGATAAVFESSGLLPVLGPSLLALGAGVGIGSAICNVVGIEGCWLFDSEGSTTEKVSSGGSLTEGRWIFDEAPAFAGQYAFSYHWQTQTSGGLSVAGLAGKSDPSCAQYISPGSVTRFINVQPSECKGSGKWGRERSTLAGRSLTYSPSGAAGRTVKSHTAPSNWSEKLATEITGHSDDPAGDVGQQVASKIAGSEVQSPYGTYVNIPDCDGLVYAGCAELLEELGLEPHREELDWTDVETTTPNEVRELEPAKSKEVEKGTSVKVITNPDEAGMPIVVPQPEPGETYSHYAARLNPSLTPEREDLDAAFIDTGTGPNGVVRVSPEPETKLDPSTSHKVNVKTNPADAPIVAPPWSPPGLASIDMDPISGVPSPCTVFPFGLFCWMGEAFAQFNTSGTCPHFSAPVAGTESEFAVTMCGQTADTIMGYLRPALLLAFIVGCGLLFAKGTKAIGGD